MGKLPKGLQDMINDISNHDQHNKQQIGVCVYCNDCDKRLYQGRL